MTRAWASKGAQRSVTYRPAAALEQPRGPKPHDAVPDSGRRDRRSGNTRNSSGGPDTRSLAHAHLLAHLRDELEARDTEIEQLQAEIHRAQMSGIAIGVLLARTPGWTEYDAFEAWDDACIRFAPHGDTAPLCSYVLQTGHLPHTP